jgi:NOL1/NOP2/fmu family ribosome biogenesis protein
MQIKKMKILGKNEVETVENIVEKNYGTGIDLNQFLVLKTFEEKIWLATKELTDLDLSKLPVNSVGMNFGKLKRNDKINLTIEGSQMVGIKATKNVVLLDKENAEKFMQGSDVKPQQEINCEYHNFTIVKSGEDVLGSSLLTEKGIKNQLPKSRRITQPKL